jgi:4-coumarate--CoA ligase (photoactive yellow protein activation family)
MLPELLGAHAASDLVCFGRRGPRGAGQLLAFAARIAAQLPERESDPRAAHEPPARVVIACRDRYYFMAAWLAALQRGVEVWLPANGQPETVLGLGRSERVAALLHDQPGQPGIDVSVLERPDEQSAARFQLPGAREPSIVLFTSGSTGAPQAHHKSLGQLLREAHAHLGEFGLRGRRCAASVPPHHIYGLLFSVCVPLLGGGSALRDTPLFPRELCAEMVRFGADVMISVPPQLFALAQDTALALPLLHRVFSSAGPLAAEVHAALNARGLPVTEILGSTETGGIAFRERPEAPWRPLPQVRTSIDADSVLSVDSPWLADAAPRPLRTADRAERVGEGFRYLGRADAVAKIGGRRVDLGDVEACLRAQPGVRDTRVLAVESGGARGLALWVVIEADAELALDPLRAALARRFDPVTLPKRYRVVAALPRSESGKVPRSALLALFDVWEFTFRPLPDGSMLVPVPRNTGFVRGHFEGDPILPGVVQLKHIALREVRRRFPELGPVARVTRVKFKRIVQPGEELTLTIERKGAHQVQFAMRVGSEPSCSGIFHFREASQ